MPSILFMNWELLSGALTDNIVRTRQHSSANVKGSWHVSTAAPSLPLSLFPRIDMMKENVNRSQGSNSIVLKHPRKLHFLHFSEQFSLLSLARSHGNFISTAITVKGTGLLLCKPRKLSSHTVCLCAPPGLLPHPDVYSLTAHSYWALAFEVSAHSENMLMANDDYQSQSKEEVVGMWIAFVQRWYDNMAFTLFLNKAKHSLRKKNYNLDFRQSNTHKC